MAIPASQLETWGNQGAIATAQSTHLSLRNALASHAWPSGVAYEDFLQGSYRNHTNIRGDSDVDLVAQVTSVFWSNLSHEEKLALGHSDSSFTLSEFRLEVIRALTQYYGTNLVDTSGSKSVKILSASGRLPADLVVAGKYLYYENLRVRAEGIIFWTVPGGIEIINYPKPHFDNGAEKNSENRTRGWFKHTVRVFKNARNRIVQSKPSLEDRFPSYFIECLLYNVPDTRFGGGEQTNFIDVVNWLSQALQGPNASSSTTQSGMQYLFGPASTQWSLPDAQLLASELTDLWDKW